MKTMISFAAVLRFAALALVVPITSAFAAQGTDAKSIPSVLQEVKQHAGQANDDAEVLDSFRRTGVSWQSHAWCLNEIRQHVEDLMEDYSRLQTMADKATPQQRDAINQLKPLLREMTTDLEKTIQTLNENQKHVNMPSYRARIHTDYLNINRVYRELCKCVTEISS